MGATIGTIIAIVAHEDPVEKLIAAAVKKVTAGSNSGDNIPALRLTR